MKTKPQSSNRYPAAHPLHQPAQEQPRPAPFGANLDPLLRLPAVISASGLQRSTIYERMAKGTFPKNINLGGRAVAWRQSAIQAWVESLEAAQ